MHLINATFHDININKTVIVFKHYKMNYFHEKAFKSFFDNRNNKIYYSEIDCNHYRNHWMIRDKKQVQSGICSGNQNRNTTVYSSNLNKINSKMQIKLIKLL